MTLRAPVGVQGADNLLPAPEYPEPLNGAQITDATSTEGTPGEGDPVTPTKGMRFLHKHRITGSPRAGTAQPVEMVVTAVRQGTVYYRPITLKTSRAAWKASLEIFPTIVKEVLE